MNIIAQNPQFLESIFLRLAEILPEPLASILDLKNEIIESFLYELSSIQDSFLFRCQRRSRLMADYLIDEDGELKEEALENLIIALQNHGYIIYPRGYDDGLFTQHVLRILKNLKKFYPLIKKFQNPSSQRLVLSACLHFLRQSIGSCFATAPAIYIHDQMVEHMIADFYEILTTGKLKRVFGGKEYSVPMSPTTGSGDLKKVLDPNAKIWFSPALMKALLVSTVETCKQLILPHLNRAKTVEELIHLVFLEKYQLTEKDLEIARRSEKTTAVGGLYATSSKFRKVQDFFQKEKEAKEIFKAATDNPLLKTWEFTLASFSEIKMEFSRWNLYASLGLDPQEKGGIGEVIVRYLEDKLGDCNEKIQEYQREYEVAFSQVKGTEGLLKRASSESEVRRLQAELQSRYYHMQSCLEMRDIAYSKGSYFSNFYNFLIREYDGLFQEYFQEIYDAALFDSKVEEYHDSPAGFRLVYKHGRTDASLWTLIEDEETWIYCLTDFFKSTETHLMDACEWEEGKGEIVSLTSSILFHLRTQEFLVSALNRMGKGRTPWSYISGGTMNILLKTYFRRENEITIESKQVENETELCIFILDVLKGLPPNVTQEFLENPHKGMLMQSPTHAFILHPGWSQMKEGWLDSGFTYTWIRDNWIHPQINFYENLYLTADEQRFLAGRSVSSQPLSIIDFRNELLKIIPSSDTVDSYLYASLPLIQEKEWKSAVKKILQGYESDLTFDVQSDWLSALALKDLAKACFLKAQSSCALNFDLHHYIAKRTRELGYAVPKPLFFADSNWTHGYFAFLVNPGTNQLELWRMDSTGSEGAPMSEWKGKKGPWVIYPRPYEYS